MHQVGLDFAVLFVALCSAERQREVTEADAPALASGARPSGVFIGLSNLTLPLGATKCDKEHGKI